MWPNRTSAQVTPLVAELTKDMGVTSVFLQFNDEACGAFGVLRMGAKMPARPVLERLKLCFFHP